MKVEKNKKRIFLTLYWFPVILILIFPFSLELIVWGLVDKFSYPEIQDYILTCVFVVACLSFTLILFRSWFKAVSLSFAFITFIIFLLELEHILDKLLSMLSIKGILHMIIPWMISFVFSLAAAIFAFYLIKTITRKKAYVAVLTFLSLIIIFFNFLLLRPHGSLKKTTKSADIILVVMDTARADHLSVYGYNRPTSPGLEWIAQKAAVYERAMSPASWTPSGHASLFTGLLPSEHGTDGDFHVFDPPGLTLSEVLREAGYKTAAIVNNPMLAPSFGWNRGFGIYKTTWTMPTLSFSRIVWMIKRRHEDWPWFGSTKRTLYSARRWWAGNQKHPRFLFLNLIDPHSPYGESHKFQNVFLDNATLRAPDISNDSEDYDAGIIRAEGTALRRVIARYDGDIRFMDFCLESFFRWLEKRKELDKTLIILTSDHGERLGERRLLGHQLGLDHVLLHVPLIVRFPAAVSACRIQDPVQTHGVYSTVLNIAGIKPKQDNPEKMPALEQQKINVTFAQMRHQGNYLQSLKERNPAFDPSPFAGDWSSASDGTWKLHLSNLGDIRLYNLLDDPSEEKNLVNDFPEEAKRLLSHIKFPDFNKGKKAKDIPKKVKELLESLGYVHK